MRDVDEMFRGEVWLRGVDGRCEREGWMRRLMKSRYERSG